MFEKIKAEITEALVERLANKIIDEKEITITITFKDKHKDKKVKNEETP